MSYDRSLVTKLRKQQAHARTVNAFADLLAAGVSTRLAAQQLGMKPSWGTSTLGHIRRGLGPQAV